MTLRVDAGRCQGHTMCKIIAPDLFELDEIDGHSRAVVAEPSGDQLQRARTAATSCPEGAIAVDA